MKNKRFIYLILAAFVAGIFLLTFLQFNSSKNIDALITGNEKTLQELTVNNNLRGLERDVRSLENKVRSIIEKKDTGRIEKIETQIAEIQGSIGKLQLINDDDTSSKYVDELNVIVQQKIVLANQTLDSFYTSGKASADKLFTEENNKKLTDSIRSIIRKIDVSRQQLLTNLTEEVDKSGRQAKRWGNILIIIVLGCSIGIFWFIIDRLKHQQDLIFQLNESEKQVRESSRVKENFMANMSHEIRTPMNAILGFTNLLQQKQLDKEAKEFTGAIQKSGEGLLNIINDILDSSKIEAGMMRIESAPFNIRLLMDSVKVMFSEKIKDKNLTFGLYIKDDVPEQLTGDSMRLTQILVNLIGNAIKFTEKGSITITVENLGISNNIALTHFTIADTGIGIEQKNIDTIFDRFQQAEDSTTRRYGGTGLGLSIVKDLVLLQKGDINVKSEPGSGTTFSFTIPYHVSLSTSESLQQTDISVQNIPHLPPCNILVAEDNEINQSLMKHLLKSWGCTFDIVSNGKEAIEMLTLHNYDLVLMDIQMPFMDGYTTTRQIRAELNLDIPVIAMTAHALRDEKEKCIASGMNDYISKPIDATRLLELITRLIPAGENNHTVPASKVEQNNFKYIRLEYLHELSNGDKAYEKLVTGQFLEMVPEEIRLLLNYYNNNQLTPLKQTAHNMKTTVSIMGLTPALEPALDAIELTTSSPVDISGHVKLIEAVCKEALKEAKAFYQSI
ncbi:MAG: ATP-binding protein [Agriterribacter sp.]